MINTGSTCRLDQESVDQIDHIDQITVSVFSKWLLLWVQEPLYPSYPSILKHSLLKRSLLLLFLLLSLFLLLLRRKRRIHKRS